MHEWKRGAVLLCALTSLLGVQEAYGQWIEAPGSGWVQADLYHQDTRRLFGSEGDTQPIFADGHAVTTSLYVTAAAGLVVGLDAWAQLPFHRLVFEDAAARRERAGIGDPRFFLRAGPSLVGVQSPVPVALRVGVKLPGGDFPVDAEVIPLGEGQRDWELLLEIGHAFGRRPLYAGGWVGYRWRETNEETARDPGDERFAYAAIGGRLVRDFTWKLAVEGWASQTPEIQGIPVSSARREMLQVLPRLGWTVGPGVLEVGGRLPLLGRNLPAGPSFSAGYFFSFDFFPGDPR